MAGLLCVSIGTGYFSYQQLNSTSEITKQKDKTRPKRNRQLETIKLKAKVNKLETKKTKESLKPGDDSLRK